MKTSNLSKVKTIGMVLAFGIYTLVFSAWSQGVADGGSPVFGGGGTGGGSSTGTTILVSGTTNGLDGYYVKTADQPNGGNLMSPVFTNSALGSSLAFYHGLQWILGSPNVIAGYVNYSLSNSIPPVNLWSNTVGVNFPALTVTLAGSGATAAQAAKINLALTNTQTGIVLDGTPIILTTTNVVGADDGSIGLSGKNIIVPSALFIKFYAMGVSNAAVQASTNFSANASTLSSGTVAAARMLSVVVTNIVETNDTVGKVTVVNNTAFISTNSFGGGAGTPFTGLITGAYTNVPLPGLTNIYFAVGSTNYCTSQTIAGTVTNQSWTTNGVYTFYTGFNVVGSGPAALVVGSLSANSGVFTNFINIASNFLPAAVAGQISLWNSNNAALWAVAPGSTNLIWPVSTSGASYADLAAGTNAAKAYSDAQLTAGTNAVLAALAAGTNAAVGFATAASNNIVVVRTNSASQTVATIVPTTGTNCIVNMTNVDAFGYRQIFWQISSPTNVFLLPTNTFQGAQFTIQITSGATNILVCIPTNNFQLTYQFRNISPSNNVALNGSFYQVTNTANGMLRFSYTTNYQGEAAWHEY